MYRALHITGPMFVFFPLVHAWSQTVDPCQMSAFPLTVVYKDCMQ